MLSVPDFCREGLVWVDIDWMDNGECLDLIEKVRGGSEMLDSSDEMSEMTMLLMSVPVKQIISGGHITSNM